MNATGTINITNELTLTDPSLEVVNVSYNWITNKINVEIYFTEENATFNHSRTFEFDNASGTTKKDQDIITLINNDDVLNVFS